MYFSFIGNGFKPPSLWSEFLPTLYRFFVDSIIFASVFLSHNSTLFASARRLRASWSHFLISLQSLTSSSASISGNLQISLRYIRILSSLISDNSISFCFFSFWYKDSISLRLFVLSMLKILSLYLLYSLWYLYASL